MTSPTGNTSHPVTQQHDHQGLIRWTCLSCGWVTPWGRPGNASNGAAAVRHAGGMDQPQSKEGQQ